MKLEIFFVILAVICALYSIMVRMAGSGTGFYLIWLVLAAGFIALAAFRRFDVWSRMPKWINVGCHAVTVLGIVTTLVLSMMIFSSFRTEGEKNLDYIVVLGAQVRESGPSVVLRFRLKKAAEYLENNPDTKCIVSGGQGANEPEAEGTAMKKYLIEKGVDEGRIIVEDRSENTSENLEYSAAFLDKENDSVGIVTNNFHVLRAVGLAKKQGYKNVCGIAAPSSRRFLPNNMLRECMGLIKDFVLK